MRNESEQKRPGRVFSRRLFEARKRRGWNQSKVAERLVEVGYVDETGRPLLSRATLSKIEQNDRAVTLEDVLALAAALDTTPTHLIVPLEDDDALQVTRGLPAVPAPVARSWIRGKFALRVVLGVGNPQDGIAFLTQVPTSELVRAGQGLGLDADQIADMLSGVRTGVPPWLSGGPWPDAETAKRKELADLQRDIDNAQARIAELTQKGDTDA